MGWQDDAIVTAPVTQGGQEPWRSDALVNMPPDKNTALDWLKNNMATPGGIGGSIVGTVMGIKGGPPGMIAGGIIGGALGSGGGSVASDVMMDRDINFTKAITEAGISLGMDFTIFGLGKYIARPAFEAAKAAFKKGTPVEDIATELARRAEEAKRAGMTDDAIESEEILAERGLSLTPFQAGLGGKWDIAKELIGRTGILSKNVFDGQSKQIRELVQERMALVSGNQTGLSDDLVGQGVSQAWQAGRKALNNSYGESLDKIGNLVAGGKFKLSVLSDSIDNFVKKNSDELGDSELSKETMSIISDLKGRLTENTVASGRYLIQFEKRLNGLIEEASKDSTKAVTELQLVNLKKEVQGVISQQMDNMGKMSQKAVDAGTQYRKLQSDYSGVINSLFPKINDTFVKSAKQESYVSLGAMFARPGKVQNVQKAFKSIDEAYKLITPDVAKGMMFKTAKEAKDAIAQGYLTKTMPDIANADFSLRAFKTVAKQLKNPTEAKRLRVILGRNFESYRRTVNLMVTANKKPASGLALLFLRGKEYAAGAGLAGGLLTGALDTAVAGASAITILGTPYFLAKAATNPKTINKLIQINKSPPKKALQLGAMLANDVLDEAIAEGMPDENLMQMLKGYDKLDTIE